MYIYMYIYIYLYIPYIYMYICIYIYIYSSNAVGRFTQEQALSKDRDQGIFLNGTVKNKVVAVFIP